MPSAISRRQMSPEFKIGYMPDLSPSLLNFDDPHRFMPSDDQLLFDMEDVSFTHDASSGPFSWDLKNDTDSDIKPAYYTAGPSPLSSNYDYLSQASPTDSFYDPSAYLTHEDSTSFDNNLFGSWIHEPELIPIPSPVAPIPISPNDPQNLEPFFTFGERSHFPQDHGLSPSEFAALQPLPMSPSSSYEESHAFPRQRVDSMTSISPADISAVQTPEWVSLFDNTATPSSISIRTPASSRPSVRHSPISSDGVQRIRMPRRASITSSQLFQSASAPSHSHLQSQSRSASSMASRRAESVSLSDDRDATVRRRRKVSNTSVEEHEKSDKPNDSVPTKSALRPPKLAPSAWQLYFTDWIQRQQASNTRKLNVAQAAKEAGQEYASLSAEEKEPYKLRSQAMKEAREREHAAYMRTLTPEDIKRENVFRAAQRKAGKSRKSNIKDPNAPKKPLSAYFMFLQRIRANPQLVQKVFGDETETTKQSVLAAAKWRSMTDDERKPFLAQAEQEKMEYEAARRLYEEGTTGYGTSISFSILPGSPIYQPSKLESESESDSGSAVDGFHRF
ncbi:MAG: putative HMG1 protein [Lentinula lateritia]|uniref:HMG1 protein n=1 Tax=Lentinula lateritia TaxID=40482 RepID=A0ABQ8VK80_9AGAR|nr:putative HMG1 protein [Lentinula novae-zelandiae]KAJ3932993.1 MAG: putative HMG1 protein [Lentinula lateritia]KAJ4496790.1 putative HMG1 protein [Lentinula lateritia]